MADDIENSSAVVAGAFGLTHDSWGRLVLIDSSGRRHSGVEPVRAFPIADPQHWISICDAEGRELVLVEDLAKIPQPVRQVLEDELARREFVPHVRRIVKVSTDVEPSEWDVETDRGPTRFLLNCERRRPPAQLDQCPLDRRARDALSDRRHRPARRPQPPRAGAVSVSGPISKGLRPLGEQSGFGSGPAGRLQGA